VAYSKTTWVNNQAPAINATNLNKVEAGIEDAHDDIATINALDQIANAPQAAVADATGTGDVVARLNELLARMRTLGLIST
jgi:hypothetical protein